MANVPVTSEGFNIISLASTKDNSL